MIKLFWILLIIVFPSSCLAGVSVLGTRFFIDDSTNSLNIKVFNDDEGDYLVKATVNDDRFIIAPPLFVLPRDKSNIITIIPKEGIRTEKDVIYSLTISTIPKSEVNDNDNIISLALRSHFNIIYRHKLPADEDYNKVILKSYHAGEWSLENPTKFAFVIFLSKNTPHHSGRVKVLGPGQSVSVNEYCSKNSCSLWLNFIGEENDFVKKINLISG